MNTHEEELVTAPLDELLIRLEHLERRMARLEALAGTGRANSEQAEQLRTAIAEARSVAAAVSPAPALSDSLQASVGVTSEIRVVAPPTPESSPPPTKQGPPTLRLAPIPPKEPSDAFPDLSELDEKVERKKGPAQKLDVHCALEDYPRICTRVQQLWGSTECEAYLNTLVIDTRGNRKGFPPAMMEELLYLGRLARALVILNIGGDLWDAYDQVGDRR